MLNIPSTFEVIKRRDSHPQARQDHPSQGILIRIRGSLYPSHVQPWSTCTGLCIYVCLHICMKALLNEITKTGF